MRVNVGARTQCCRLAPACFAARRAAPAPTDQPPAPDTRSPRA
jgi:hypothetical protein